VTAGLRTVALVVVLALSAAAATLLATALLGMDRGELGHVLVLVAPAAAASLAAALLARPLVARLPAAAAFAAVGTAGAVVGLVNFLIFWHLMLVSSSGPGAVALVLAYATVVAVAASVSLARRSADAVDRLSDAAGRMGAGDLSARVGDLDASAELRRLAATMDSMAERLEAAAGRERELEQRRRELTTAVSHDLRTPLASLRAMAEAIEDGVVADPESLRRYVVEIRRSTVVLTGLVDDLFELAQLDAAMLEEERAGAQLAEVVASAVAAVEGAGAPRGVTIHVQLGPAEGAPCSPRLARVVQNLLDNAVRHSPAGGQVVLAATMDAGRLEITVEDAGEGIDQADVERMFEPFWRGDPARSGDGAGLGLPLAKRITEALGGGIAATSARGRGTTFAVTLPLPR
jgi:signal transduction histidine kinase